MIQLIIKEAKYLKTSFFYVLHFLMFLFKETLNHFAVEDPKFARFYLLPKIHKRSHNVPGSSIISNCDLYTENISSFLDYHLQPFSQKDKTPIAIGSIIIKVNIEHSEKVNKFLRNILTLTIASMATVELMIRIL